MHELQIAEELRAETLIKGDRETIGREDCPDQLDGAALAGARGGGSHQRAADAPAPRLGIDPEIGDEHDARSPVDIVAEIVEEIARRGAILLGDQAGEGGVGTEAIAPEDLGAEILLV